MKCIIIDDDAVQRHLLTEYAKQFENLEIVGEFSSTSEAVNFMDNAQVDLIILDVEMPMMTGVEFLENYQPNAHVILISSSERYAINGFHHEVDDYLLKPITFARFSKAIHKIGERIKTSKEGSQNFLFIKDKGIFQKVLIDDILYIQSASEYVTIYTDKKRIMLYSSMDGILAKLTSRFLRVHRSYIVNLDKIERVNGNMVEINGHSINISKTYHDNLMNALGLKVKTASLS